MKMRCFQVQDDRATILTSLNTLKINAPTALYGDCLNSRLDIVPIFGKLVSMPVYTEQNRDHDGLSKFQSDSQVYRFQGDLHE